ncbi:EAL domain-containing protein [Aliivibrio sp. S3MY1]|uniref:EAL and HDOD domain-containing protein n=1 Tax=unclassified Aliivibrio TaxID=2645654 RepID=UPI0023784EBD|nr:MULTISPECIES: EAL domain-containing protein [unclassified Aliivibrio]MDD9196766.1 EAL domain-containing protein [Aliivibrio sp. S3MY1]MDD9200480.1 EAL domain-containing protein [Aliivibrio sp. S2MY1]
MYSYIARQPILDIKKNTIGYELLFRDGPKNTFPAVEAEEATSRLLSDHFISAHCNATNDKLGFVNFPHQSLINLVPTLFNSNNLVVEILEDCIPNQELLAAVKTLSERGYKLALDDFEPHPDWTPFLPYINIIKFDIQATPILKAKLFIRHCKKYNISFLAEKVENYEEFELAKSVGFTYFQGYFFSKPEMLQQRSMRPNQLSTIQLYKEISAPIIDFEAVEKQLVKDVSLSYKLLRFVNLSSVIDQPINSFKQALVYLGENKLRQFISLVAVAHATKNKPHSLYTLSIHRAKLCELIVNKTSIDLEPSQAFLVGLFSLLEPLLDQPLDELLQRLPISTEIKLALTKRTGSLGMLLLAIESYEKADWLTITQCCAALKITEEEFTTYYQESAEWVDDVAS